MSFLRSRFQKDTNKLVQEYTASIAFDQRSYRQNIGKSIAHVTILQKQGVTARSSSTAKKRKWISGRIEDGN